MLGGMFKRKDKKSKGQDKEFEDNEKTSGEPLQQALSPPSRLSPQPKESMETLTQEGQASKAASQPLRQTSKLQKSPPAQIPPKSSYSQREAASQRTPNADPQIVFQAESTSQRLPVSEQQTSFISGSTSQPGFADEKSKFIPEPQSQRTAVTGQPNDSIPEPSRPPPIVSEPVGSMRLVQPEPDMGTEDSARALNFNPLMTSRDEQIQSESPRDGRRGMFSQIQDALRSSPSEPDAEKAKPRMHIDDFDTSEEEEHEPTFQRESLDEPDSHLSIAQNAQYVSYEPQAPTSFQPHIEQAKERLSESPVEVSPPQDRYRTPQPPPLMVDTSSQEDPSTSPISPVSSPELIEASNEKAGREETPASTAQSSTPTWSDASLRAYLDDDSDIRDLLVVVHDKSQFKPIVGRDHPAVQTLFKEENRKLGEISNRLDGLLGDYLARKQGTAVR